MVTKRFYRASYDERLAQVVADAGLTSNEQQLLMQAMQPAVNTLIENGVTSFGLPQGIVPNVTIDGVTRFVPMVTEEPSVIAAASNGVRLFNTGDGLHTTQVSRGLIGQIIFTEIQELPAFVDWVKTQAPQLVAVANAAHPSLQRRGGGAESLTVRQLSATDVSLDLLVNPMDAMGANMVNAMAEAVAEAIEVERDISPLLAILSNNAQHETVTVQGHIPLAQLQTPAIDGPEVATRIVEAQRIAMLDSMRAATHNKGIMNGVDAVAIALGNDWRAIESGVHSAAAEGGYHGLGRWWCENDALYGELTLAIPAASVGGAIKVLPLVAVNQKIAKITDAKSVMSLLAGIGLAQNLAALKALVTEGIQGGHMALQWKTLAQNVGATPAEIPVIVAGLKQHATPNEKIAKQLLNDLRQGRDA